MVNGPTGLLGRLTGDGHEVDDLLGAKGGRASRPGGVGEHLGDQAPQRRLRGLLPLGLLQLGRRLQPAVAPVADGQAGQAQLPSHDLDARLIRQGQEDRGPSDQALVSGLLPHQALEQGLLHRGEREGNRRGCTHGSIPSTKARAIPEKGTVGPPRQRG